MSQIDELIAPPSLLCAAVQDVMGIQFDPASAADLTIAAGLARKLSDDPEKSGALAASLARHNRATTVQPVPTLEILKTIRWQTAPSPMDATADLQEDVPSFAIDAHSAAPALPARSRFASEPDVDVIVQLQPFSPGLHTPDCLGFDFSAPAARWDASSLTKWHSFMASAEDKLPLWSTLTERLKTFTHRKPVALAEQAARNHCVVNLHANGNDSAAHFLFEGDDVYMVVVHIGGQQNKAKANIADVDAFSRTIVTAFDGNFGDAHAALASLRHALS